MFARELPDGTYAMIEQEDHTDLSAQFAAHWGNERFSRPEPFQSVLFGTIYHDSGHREMEADLPIDVERGVPYAIGRTPPGLRRAEADAANAQWVRGRDPYASLLVSMHHAGLRKDRYGSARKRTNGPDAAGDGKSAGFEAAFADLEPWQRAVWEDLGLDAPKAREAFWHNYRLLQVFDLLSLYFCRDGVRDGKLQEVVYERVPVRVGSDEVVELQLTPTGPASLRMAPYPLDADAVTVAIMTRVITPAPDAPEPVARERYYQARRVPLVCEITK
ncbi:MAG TPA: DUF3891 family protein [Chloroflexota bacterium]|nr:DUF3891 family protein [Chloroflexota bacterium]